MDPNTLMQLSPLFILLLLMYFMMIRPQQKQQRERRSMLDSLKVGDKVVTIGGFHGTIKALDETTVRLQLADSVEVTINRSAVGGVRTES